MNPKVKTSLWHKRFAAIGAAAVALLAIFCAGFLFTMVARSGFWLLFSFGLIGIIVFLQSFPWLVLAAFIALDVGLVLLLRQLSYIKQKSVTLLSLMLIVITLGGGFLLSRTPIYRNFHPPAPQQGSSSDPFRRGYGAWRFHNLFPGTVTEVQEKAYVMTAPDGQKITVRVTSGTEFPEGMDIVKGDSILVIGRPDKDGIAAFGIRPFTLPRTRLIPSSQNPQP